MAERLAMALTEVKISEETYLTCLTHALSTETEEIMGLLLGDIEVWIFSASAIPSLSSVSALTTFTPIVSADLES